MERYAQDHPGAFTFSRPIYGDGTERPFFVECDLPKEGRECWVQTFPNRDDLAPSRGFEHAPPWRRRSIPPSALDARR